MTVVARLVMDIVAFHSLEPYDHILQRLVPARPHMGRIGYKRWTVQKVELGLSQKSSFCLLVGLASLPPVENLFLGFWRFVLAAYLAYGFRRQWLSSSGKESVESKISGLAPGRRFTFPKKVGGSGSIELDQNYETYYSLKKALRFTDFDFPNASQIYWIRCTRSDCERLS